LNSRGPPQIPLVDERGPRQSRSDEGRKIVKKLEVQGVIISSESDLPGMVEEFDEELLAVD
jgi:hypothetical protein